MYTWSCDLRIASLLSDGLAHDAYSEAYFRRGRLGACARFLFFLDELKLRRNTGLVIWEGHAVAFVGLPPNSYIRARDLSLLTRMALLAEGEPYRSRWAVFFSHQASDFGEENGSAYLSAIACHPACRGRGVGTRLLERVKASVVELRLSLICDVSSHKLLRWYEERGFDLVEEWKLPTGLSAFRLSFNAINRGLV